MALTLRFDTRNTHGRQMEALRLAKLGCKMVYTTQSGPRPCPEPRTRGSEYCLRHKHATARVHG